MKHRAVFVYKRRYNIDYQRVDRVFEVALKRAPDRLRFRFSGSLRDRFSNEPAVPTRTLLKFAVIGIFYSQVVFLNRLLLVLTSIVMQTCAYDNSSSTEDAQFSNAPPTASFQTQKANGSC